MLEIILSGGLGNQLFQYSFGRYLSKIQKRPLQLNCYGLGQSKKGETPRSFALANLNISCPIVNEKRLIGRSRLVNFALKRNLFSKYSFEENNLSAEIFWGYWLNRKYSDEIRNELLKEISFEGNLSAHDVNLFSVAESQKILSVHVRRGDYIHNQNANNFHGVLAMEYYQQAIHKADAGKYSDVWFFSDDPNWCRANFPKFRTVSLENPDPVVDILLMSRCHGNILANSTFSWWAGWLNQNIDKKVIIPEKWFALEKNPPIYGPDWILCKNSI